MSSPLYVCIAWDNFRHQVDAVHYLMKPRTVLLQMETKVRAHSRIIQFIVEAVAVYPRHVCTQSAEILKIKMLGYSQIVTAPETIPVSLFRLTGQ